MEPLSTDDPARVAAYQVRARLGAGAMGKVYLAYTPDGRAVALKIVRPEFGTDPTFRERFRQQVDAASRVHGLYTAQVLDADPDATPPWLVTAYVPGPSLLQAVAQHGPMPPDSVFQLIAGVAEALGAIHAAGLVHRDLKPSNVILAPDGPRVTDFGIARAIDASAITVQDMRVGSRQFMAPEQIMGLPPTPAVDVFALGHLAAYAVLGHSLFGDQDEASVFARILNQPPDLTGCPQPLRALIERCLSKDPDARPAPGDIVAACRGHQNPHNVQAAGSWLPPAMAAAAAQHATPPPPTPYTAQPVYGAPLPPQPAPTMPGPPPTYSHPTGGAPRPPTGVYISRSALVRAGVAVVVIAVLVAVGVVLLHRDSHTRQAAPPRPSPTAAATTAGSQSPTAGHPSPSRTSGLDSCVFGTWKGVSQTATNNINGEPAQFTGPGPDTVTLRPDGTGATSFGSGVTFRANGTRQSWTEVVTGGDTYDYQTSNGSFLLSKLQASGTESLYVNGIQAATAPISPKLSNGYTCSGNSLKFFAADGSGSTELTRISS